MRSTTSLMALTVSMVALAACNPFSRSPVTEVSRDANANARWNATLVTPANLAGAVQLNGSATMQPTMDDDGIRFSVQVANATPGGLHPWQVHRGSCNADGGVFGRSEDYGTVKIGDDGRGESGATTATRMPVTGDYFVVMYASEANPSTVVACGNLAPPSR